MRKSISKVVLSIVCFIPVLSHSAEKVVAPDSSHNTISNALNFTQLNSSEPTALEAINRYHYSVDKGIGIHVDDSIGFEAAYVKTERPISALEYDPESVQENQNGRLDLRVAMPVAMKRDFYARLYSKISMYVPEFSKDDFTSARSVYDGFQRKVLSQFDDQSDRFTQIWGVGASFGVKTLDFAFELEHLTHDTLSATGKDITRILFNLRSQF